jgi:hypothetical protein
MAQFARNPETGEFAIRYAGEDWQLVDEVTYTRLKAARDEGAPETFLRSLGDSVRQLATGAASLLTNPDSAQGRLSREQFQDITQTQEVRRQSNPIAATAGAVLPDVAVGALTGGGGSLAARVGTTAAVEGAIGAARNPDAPLQGALVQGALGAAGGAAAPLVDRFVGSAQTVVNRARAASRGPDDLNAARNPDPSDAGGGERQLEGYLTPEELDELAADFSEGRLYTRGDRQALEARTVDDLDAADDARRTEELMRSNVIGDSVFGGIGAIRDRAEGIATKVVMRELGENRASRLTSTTARRLRDEIVQPFEDAARAAGDLRLSRSDVGELDRAVLEASADDRPLVESVVSRLKEDLSDDLVLRQEQASQYRTRLGSDIRRAAQAGRYERAQSLGDVQDVIDEIVERQVPADVSEALAEARYRYRIWKSLERSSATTTAGGEINLRSFMNAYERSGGPGANRFGRSSGRTEQGDRFFRTLETLRFLTDRVEPSSGTAQRLLANTIPQGLPGLLGGG